MYFFIEKHFLLLPFICSNNCEVKQKDNNENEAIVILEAIALFSRLFFEYYIDDWENNKSPFLSMSIYLHCVSM